MTGLYIHIPFCKQKCFYCDFFSQKYNSEKADIYLNALSKQAEIYKGRVVDSVYIGGGTPSVLSLEQIRKLLKIIKNSFILSNIKEFTFEVNPESADIEKFKLLKDYGVDRMSIGLQSPNDKDLKYLGRIHDFNIFKNAFEYAKRSGFENISIDLIYGLPGQSIDEWKNNIETAIKFDSSHISLYPLSVEENTVFGRNSLKVNDNSQRDMYEAAIEVLSQYGFVHYEISNWAKSGKEAVHNSNYWRNLEYIALGSGAAGYLERKRYKIIENIDEYIELSEKGIDLKTEEEYIDDKLYETESIMLGLRLLEEGVSADTFKSQHNKSVMDNLIGQGVLVKDGERIKIHKDYVFISNSLISEFI